jgi:hypothetical protein
VPDTDPILAATPDVLRQLAEHGAQPTKTIAEWCAPHDVEAREWLTWAREAKLVERIYGNRDDAIDARWAVSPEQLIKVARDHSRR